MPNPPLLKGAIVYFTPSLAVARTNLIVFQYNPEAITRSLTRPVDGQDPTERSSPQRLRSEPLPPDEEIDVTLYLDATDDLERDRTIARATGIADHLSALELLAYPRDDGRSLAIPQQLSLLPPGLTAPTAASKMRLPIALFVWGPGRIVPVRVKQLRVEEQQWNQALYPTRAKVTLGMVVLTPQALQLDLDDDPRTPGAELAVKSYELTFEQKKVLAAVNLLDTATSSSAATILRRTTLPIL